MTTDVKHTVTIELEGGLIQDVIGLPEGIRIRVEDYDIEGSDPDEEPAIEKVERSGRFAFVSYWSNWEGISE